MLLQQSTFLFELNNLSFYLTIGAIALILDLMIADFSLLWKILPHPITIIGKAISLFDKTLNRGGKNSQLLLGGITAVLIIGGFGELGYSLERIISTLQYAPYINLVIVTIIIAGGALKTAVKKVMIAIDKGDNKKAQLQTSKLCARDTSSMDNYGCGRSALESLVENLSDGVIAPIMFYMLFGLTGLFAYKAINTLDSMIGYKSKKYLYFGKCSAKIDDVANFIPARITGLLLSLGIMFSRTGNVNSALQSYKKFAHTHNSPNAGVVESILAGALKIKLGGTRTYKDIGTITHWIGDGDEKITPHHMHRALKIYTMAIFIGAILALIISSII